MREECNEEIFGPKVPYLSTTGALMYLANYTLIDISFVVNLLARYTPHQPEDIGMVSNIFFVTSMVL